MSFIQIKLRRDSAANWTANNPVLAEGEIAIELGETPRWKVGDGTTAWDSLPYGFRGDPGPQGVPGPEGPQPPLSGATPAGLGAASAGTAAAASRADHVHPLPTPAAIGAAPASHTHTASQISDSTVTGRALITAADAAGGRAALGLGTAATQNTGTSGATIPLLDGANTFSGPATFTLFLNYKPSSGNGYIQANKSTATNLAGFWWGNELGVNRWILTTDNTTDDNLLLIRYDDSGAFLNVPFQVSSATGNFTFSTQTVFLSQVGQGGIPTAGRNVSLGANITGATTSFAVLAQGVVQSDVTSDANYFRTSVGTQATTFTLTNIRHFVAAQGTLGAGSTVTNQIGFDATPSLIGASSLNVGFRGSMPAGTGRWNFFSDGTANNAFAGNVRIGSTVAPTAALDVTGNAAISGTLTIGGNPTSAVQAGTATGQLARWNNTSGRYEPVTLNTLTDAVDDAAAAAAGVAVGGLYRTGSILKTRIT